MQQNTIEFSGTALLVTCAVPITAKPGERLTGRQAVNSRMTTLRINGVLMKFSEDKDKRFARLVVNPEYQAPG